MTKAHNDINLYQCNPATLAKTHTTCLPGDMLERLRDAWNKQFPNHAIAKTIHKKERLWAELRARLQSQYKCATEYCAVEKLGSADQQEVAAPYFRPKKPDEWIKNPTEWHNSITLTKVMEQYEAAFPKFEFIGPTPIDFDTQMPGAFGQCVLDELCKLDLASMKANGKTDIGIIFNLDPHDKPGSHWVCAYIDLKRMITYYYDSYAVQPPIQIRKLLKRCKDQGCKHVVWNDRRHQRKNSECGTYCLYVIISLLKGESFKAICENRIDDDTMNAIRDLLFATSQPSDLAIKKGMQLLKL